MQFSARQIKGERASLVALSLFTKLQQRSTLLFLHTYPTPKQQFMALLKHSGHPTAEKVASKIVEALQEPSLRADPITTSTKSSLALTLNGPKAKVFF